MQITELHQQLQTFFDEADCQILSNDPNYLIVQLTNEMDRKIMNRPFYWKYIDATGDEPNPAQLTLITNPGEETASIRGEPLHLGAPRLRTIMDALREMGSFVYLYETSKELQNGVLTPWLHLNIKVTYRCHQTKEMLYSLGMNLMTGEVWDQFFDRLKEKELATEQPEGLFPVPPVIAFEKAIYRLQQLLEDHILKENHDWADEAKLLYEKERRVLDYFYEHMEEKPAQYEVECQALKEQYEAKICMDIINGGVFYLV